MSKQVTNNRGGGVADTPAPEGVEAALEGGPVASEQEFESELEKRFQLSDDDDEEDGSSYQNVNPDEGADDDESADDDDEPSDDDEDSEVAPSVELEEGDLETFEGLSEDAQALVGDIFQFLEKHHDDADLQLSEEHQAAIDALTEEEKADVLSIVDKYLGPVSEEEDEEPEDAEDKSYKNLPKWTKLELKKLKETRNHLEGEVKASKELVTQAEAKLKETQARLAEVETQRIIAPKTRENPLSEYTTKEALNRLEQHAEDFEAWLIEHPDGGEYTHPGAKEAQSYDGSDVRKLLLKVQRDLRKNIPQRHGYLAEESEKNQMVEEAFPDLKDSSSELAQDVASILRVMPELKRWPNYKVAAVYQSLGIRAVEAFGPNVWNVIQESKAIAQKERDGKSKSNQQRKQVAPGKRKRAVPVKRMPVPALRKGPTKKVPSRVTRQKFKDRAASEDEFTELLAERFGG